MAQGSLKIMIGAAPGVGKTYAMLREGRRLQHEGIDVVIAYLETHGRKATGEQAHGLERIPRRHSTYRRMPLEDMDLSATLRRHPQVALVDELAHANVPGSIHEKRWQDVQDMIDGGIDVITTINVQHIESLNDVVRAITGSVQQETVPDKFLRTADQIEVVDIPPQMLRERLAAGEVYAPDRVDAALSHYFRIGNLTALRELALLWLAGNVDESLRQYRQEQGIRETWETRERVVVAVSGGPEGEALLRRGARVAAHSGGGELIAVHVTSSDGLQSGRVRLLSQQQALVEKLGGTFHEVVGEDIVSSIVEFSEAVDATQIVIGVSSRNPLRRYFGRPSVSDNLVEHCGSIDVHLVTHDYVGKGFTLPKVRSVLSVKRKLAGLIFSLFSFLILTPVLVISRSQFSFPSDILSYQVVVVVAAVIGGAIPAVTAALVSGAIIDVLFIEPIGNFHVYQRSGLVSLFLYVVIALIVSYVVDHAERRSHAAQRSRAESELLSSISGTVLRSHNPLQALVDTSREAFGFSQVTIVGPEGDVTSSRVESTVSQSHTDGPHVAGEAEAKHQVRDSSSKYVYKLGGDATFTTYGGSVDANDQRLLNTILTQVQMVLEHHDLARKASEIEPLTAADKIRSALLNALSHDLRRPLASATAAVSGLLREDSTLGDADRAELLQVASSGLKELSKLVTDLLDVSRLKEDALPITLMATDCEDVIVAALDELNMGPDAVQLDIQSVPLVCADPPLLRRAISNLLLNAKRFTTKPKRIVISLSRFRDNVEIRVVDYGPGVTDKRKDEIFLAFQRLGDTDNTTGLGLGLALSKGFVESMGGNLNAEDTPGGGLTMVISLCALDKNVAQDSILKKPPERQQEMVWDVDDLHEITKNNSDVSDSRIQVVEVNEHENSDS